MCDATACQIKVELKCSKKATKAHQEEAQQEYDSKSTFIFAYFISF